MMSNTYQAIYDAITVQASGLSWAIDAIRNEHIIAAEKSCAPHVLMRPRVYPDGNQWCALYGENLMEGVCGFGDTPWAACQAFDKAWNTERCGVKPA